MLEMFRLGGFGMIPTFVFRPDRGGDVGALRRLSEAEELMSLMLALGSLTLASGALGFVAGMIKSFTAVGEVPGGMRWIWLIGTAESLQRAERRLPAWNQVARGHSARDQQSERLSSDHNRKDAMGHG